MLRATGVRGFAALAAFVLVATSAGTEAEPVGSRQVLVGSDAARKWWETAVIYQVYPRSFMDSNGDGVGDLNGITSKLQYLKDLGVGAVWLSPIYPSPQADFGYDISDFTAIDPTYGTMADFEKLLKSTHDLGLKLVLDLVPNHSSDEHEWFKKSVKGDKEYADYYVWTDGKKDAEGKPIPPNNWLSNFKGSAWEWNEDRGQYYFHQYAVKQPDLNYRNPKIVQEMKDAIKFWLDKGVDGFRVDAVITLFEDTRLLDEPQNPAGGQTDPMEHDYLAHIYTENQDETYDMVVQWREILDKYPGDRVMMTEAYATLDQTVKYYGTKEKPGASFSFNFYMITDLSASSTAADFKKTIDNWMGKMNDFVKPNWVVGNHDQFRVASFFRYGGELADGINMVSLLLPGTAMTYNGEEIAMDNTYITWAQTKDPQATNEGPKNYLLRSRDLERTPFQWDTSTSAGFSTNHTTWLPVNPNYWRLNLKAQEAAEHSHLKMYKALLQARKMPAVQGALNYEVLSLSSDRVLVVKRELEGADSFMAVVNLGSEEVTVKQSEMGSFSGKLSVWTSSINSAKRPGDIVTAIMTLRPKEGVVLTTAAVPNPSSTNAPSTTVSPKSSTANNGGSSTQATSTTPKGSGGKGSGAGAVEVTKTAVLLTLLLSVLYLRT